MVATILTVVISIMILSMGDGSQPGSISSTCKTVVSAFTSKSKQRNGCADSLALPEKETIIEEYSISGGSFIDAKEGLSCHICWSSSFLEILCESFLCVKIRRRKRVERGQQYDLYHWRHAWTVSANRAVL